MAELVLTDPFISINGADVSDHFTSITLPAEAEVQESTGFGDGWRTRVGGLKDWSASLDFNQDFDAGEIDSILWPLLGAAVALVVRPTSAVVSTGNPQYFRQLHPARATLPWGTPLGRAGHGVISELQAGELTRATS